MVNKLKDVSYFTTECSPSHIFQNMSSSANEIYYIHNSEIQPRIIVIDKNLFVSKNTNEYSKFINKLNGSESLQISCLFYSIIEQTEIIAVGLYGGFKIWSRDGNRLLFQLTDNSFSDKTYSISALCARTISNKNYLIFGDSKGQIFQCHGVETNWTYDKIFTNKNNYTVTSLCSNNKTGFIAAGFENGSISIFDYTNKQINILIDFDNEYNFPCLALNAPSNTDYCIAGYLNGEIRIYSFTKLALLSSIQSHIRGVNAICSNSSGSLIASLGDDCYVNILSYDGIIKLKKSINLENKLPVGAQFLTNNNLTVCCYDCPELVLIENN